MILETFDEVNHWRKRAIIAEEKVKTLKMKVETLETEMKRMDRLFKSMEREIYSLQSRDDFEDD